MRIRELHDVLERMDKALEYALDHCEQLKQDTVMRQRPHMDRDVAHLHARIEGMARQLEDTLCTMERLRSR